MSVAFHSEPPLSPLGDLGPYRLVDYAALPDEPRCELIRGRFYVTPSPFPAHQSISLILGRDLYAIARREGGRVFTAPLDVTLAEHSVVQPDILYVTKDRLGIVGPRGIEGAPDLVVEVLSLGTARRDRREKLALYAESGVREVWLVDPAGRQIEILANDDGRFVVVLPTSPRYRSTQLPQVEIDFASFWNEVEVNG